MFSKEIRIGSRTISETEPCYVIAEAGVNHNGSRELALSLVRKAKEIGVDCVKFQTFKADQIVTRDAPKADYQLKLTPQAESQYDMLKALELELEDYEAIVDLCNELDIQFLSTPYSKSDVDFLNGLNVDGFKIASGQIIELDFLRYVAATGKPIILSTGMATLAEIDEAAKAIRDCGNDKLIVLQCTTNYPSSEEEANLLAMNRIGKMLEVLVGYSDHIPDNYTCYASVALGARVVEKHFTLDNDMPGPDHKASLNPEKFQELVEGIRKVEASLGNGVKIPTSIELSNARNMRRSIVLNKDLKAGDILTADDLIMKRPATGMPPKMLDRVIGLKLIEDLSENTQLHERHLEW
ncbi:MAG: N-acetylneuraminate synthase [Bacteroidia bacterium]|nr:N-acetylneuraminate synthase [Bacteroidia bacterium]